LLCIASTHRILLRALAGVLLVSAVLFAVGSVIERSKESTTAAAAERSSATGAPAAESAARRESERLPETSRSAPTALGHAATRGEGHGESRSGAPAHAESGSGGSGSARTASADRGSGENAAQPSSESRRSVGDSQTGSGETARERLGERHREAKLLGINPEALSLLVVALIASLLLAAAVWFRPLAPVLIAIVGFGLLFAALDVREVLHQVDESRTSLIVIAGALTGLHVVLAMLAAAALFAGRMSKRTSTRDLRDAVAG
jgi:hypothetical protein